MRASDLIDEAARFMADFDPDCPFVRWSEQNWFDAFRYALSLVAAYRPNDFSESHSITLVPGARQTLPSGCDKMLSTVDPIRKTSRKTLGLVKGRPCCDHDVSSDNYEPNSFQTVSGDDRAIYLDPPAPDDVSGTLDVVCQSTPQPDSIDEDVRVQGWLRAPILDFMLWYAFGYDTEAVPSRDRAKEHYEAAVAALQYREEMIMNRRQQRRLEEADTQ